MSAFENAPVRIKPGHTLTLFEKLRVTEFPQGAGMMLAGYTSNRSVALLLHPEGGLYVGSGVCMRVANHYPVAGWRWLRVESRNCATMLWQFFKRSSRSLVECQSNGRGLMETVRGASSRWTTKHNWFRLRA